MKLKLIAVMLLTLISFPVFVFSQGLNDLPKPKDVRKEYRPEYRKLLREYKRKPAKRFGQDDIVLDPIEQIPTDRLGLFEVAAATNWGEQLLLPDSLWQRLRDRATGKVVIKVGDTGEAQHVDLQRGLMTGTNYTTDTDRYDGNGHSTHVGGIIAGSGFGLADPLFDKGLARIKFCKVLSNGGSGSFSWVANMIKAEDAENRDLIAAGTAVVANFSLGGGTTSVAEVEAALQASTALGVVYCVAAGNTGGPVNYPGNSRYVTGVSSLDQTLTISSFSSRGPEVEQTAPGRNILSTYKGNTYATLSGTSMATPFQTALTAIAMSVYPTKLRNQSDVDAYFQKISADIGTPGKDDLYGWGLIYVKAILDTDPGGVTPPNPCEILSAKLTGTPTSCNDNGTPTNNTDDWFTQDVSVTFRNVPATGYLQIVPGGDQIGTYQAPVTILNGEYTFKAVKLKADGTPTVFNVNFTAVPSCMLTVNGAAVSSCSQAPPVDTIPVRPTRMLHIPVSGNFVMRWSVMDGKVTVDKLTTPILFNDMCGGAETLAAYKTLTITSIEAYVYSTTNADIEIGRFTKNVSWFFTNRGLGLPAGSDFGDATYWTAYFLDLLLNTQAPVKEDIVVARITGKDESGNVIIYTDKTLRNWVPTK